MLELVLSLGNGYVKLSVISYMHIETLSLSIMLT